MSVMIWIAAAWFVATAIVTFAFYGAKRSRLLYAFMFGEKQGGEVVRIARATVPSPAEYPIQLAA